MLVSEQKSVKKILAQYDFLTGGSEHSGQQVLGPPRKKDAVKDIVSDVFRKAQSGNMEQFDDSDDEENARFAKFQGIISQSSKFKTHH